jgi:FtsP/CotA-like multicopper oxidase with cupredoxin domain
MGHARLLRQAEHMPALRLRRPRAVTASIGAMTAAVVGLAMLAGCTGNPRARVDTVGQVSFENPLRLPPADPGTLGADGIRRFTLVAQKGTTTFRTGESTPTAGYGTPEQPGAYLGPTIIANRGDRIRVHVKNELDEVTTLHWHGMHLPAAMDGGPHQRIAPGASRTPAFTIDQPAATLWYHPHPHGATEHQVAAGMAGMVILHDEQEQALGLPNEYGIDDIPVIVQDEHFDRNGRFAPGDRGFVGALGDTLLVNGTVGPYLDVTTDAVRLRLLNASSARTYDFGLDDRRPFALIATDGGLLSAPAAMSHIRLSPGERAEIVVRMTPGETLTLRSTPPDLGISKVLAAPNGGTDRFDVLQLRAADALRPLAEVPSTLAPIERLKPTPGAPIQRFTLDGHLINGQKMDPNRIDTTVTAGQVSVWEVTNAMDMPHNFHIHDVQFQVLSVGGKAPPPELSGWKDTVYLVPHTPLRLIMTFRDYTDRHMPYMFHCHLLAHEDAGMMGQFLVLKPGQRAGSPPPLPRDSQEGMNHEH